MTRRFLSSTTSPTLEHCLPKAQCRRVALSRHRWHVPRQAGDNGIRGDGPLLCTSCATTCFSWGRQPGWKQAARFRHSILQSRIGSATIPQTTHRAHPSGGVARRDRPRSRQGWWGQDESARGRSRHRGVLRRWVSVSNEESLFVVCRARSFSVLWAAYAVVLGRVKQNRCVQDTPGIGKVDRNRGRAHARRDAQLYLVQSPAPRPAVAASGCLFGTCKAATLPKSETGLPSFSRNRPGGCTDVS